MLSNTTCEHSNTRLECTGFYFSSDDGMVENLHVKEHLRNSDHNLITWNISLDSTRRNVPKSEHNYNKADYDIINECFFNIDWEEMFSNIDINTMWNKFINIVEEVIDKMIPTKILKERNYPKWMTRRAKLVRKLKSTMWARFRLFKEYTDWVEYKPAQNKVTTKHRTTKRNFEKTFAENIRNDPKSFYSYVRPNSKCNDRVGPLKDVNGDIVTDDYCYCCNILNNFFQLCIYM